MHLPPDIRDFAAVWHANISLSLTQRKFYMQSKFEIPCWYTFTARTFLVQNMNRSPHCSRSVRCAQSTLYTVQTEAQQRVMSSPRDWFFYTPMTFFTAFMPCAHSLTSVETLCVCSCSKRRTFPLLVEDTYACTHTRKGFQRTDALGLSNLVFHFGNMMKPCWFPQFCRLQTGSLICVKGLALQKSI